MSTYQEIVEQARMAGMSVDSMAQSLGEMSVVIAHRALYGEGPAKTGGAVMGNTASLSPWARSLASPPMAQPVLPHAEVSGGIPKGQLEALGNAPAFQSQKFGTPPTSPATPGALSRLGLPEVPSEPIPPAPAPEIPPIEIALEDVHTEDLPPEPQDK